MVCEMVGMRASVGKRNKNILWCCVPAILVCIVMMLTACGEVADDTGSALVSEDVSVKETETVGVESQAENSGEGAISIASAPLIHSDNPQGENMADLLQDGAAGAMVQICVGDTVGSGVLWELVGDRLVIATAAHVFTMGNGVAEVTFADGWKTPIDGYEITDTDLAFLFVSLSDMPEEQLQQYYLVNVDTDCAEALQKEDGVIVMGSVSGVASDAYEGKVLDPWIYVEDFDQYMIVVNAEAGAGMSGGGLFDYEGHFLGIVCGSSADREVAIIPVSVINALYGG